MQKIENTKPQDLVGIYRELAEIIGVDNVTLVYEYFKGQQVSFPIHLYSKDFVIRQVGLNQSIPIKHLASKYGYSERWLRKLVQEKHKAISI